MLNKITLIGHLGKDPNLDYTEAGVAVGEFSLAVNHYSKSPDGERKEETDWFNVVVWRTQAENCAACLTKGALVYVEGRLTQETYTEKATGAKRLRVKVQANDVRFLTPKASLQAGSLSEEK